jgi:glutathione synthase
MDPIGSINVKKDSTLAMLVEAQNRGWPIDYMEQGDLFLKDGEAYAQTRGLKVSYNPENWFELGDPVETPLARLDAILMRKDPPFDTEYIYTTYILEQAEAAGVVVVNRCQSLRDANEKMYTAWFPQCTPPTLVTRKESQIRDFLKAQNDIVVKPLWGMGGAMVFRLRSDDPNIGVAIETLTEHGSRYAMAQRFIPEISQGDKRILLIDGEPIPYALARIPMKGETRGNLAAGGEGVGVELSERDQWICQQLAPTLREKGLLFVGLDVIGDYLTEINVTSPTCIRELDTIYDMNIAAKLMDAISARLRS